MRLPRNVFQLLIMLETAALAAVIIFGAVHMQRASAEKSKSAPVSQSEKKRAGDKSREDTARADARGSGADTAEENERPMQLQPAVFSGEVEAKLADMTLEEKTAQMFLITPEALTHTDLVEIAGESTKAAVDSYPVGGLVYASGNFKDKEQTRSMLSGVQQYSNERIGLPMFLAVQELGGEEDSPLAAANGYELQLSPAGVGAQGEADKAASAADGIASYMAEEGFNLNLMPVAELAGGADSIHDNRCYSTDAAAASMMLAENINACHARGIRTAIGAFPGKKAENSSEEDWAAWRDNDALVFQAGIGGETDCIVLSNIICEALTGEEDTLCSMSKNAVYYLRNDMGYTGIIMTGSLSEEAVTGRYSSGEAAVAAVKSGVNMLYCPANFEEAYQAVIDAVNSDEISVDTIDQAAGYILTRKLAMAGST